MEIMESLETVPFVIVRAGNKVMAGRRIFKVSKKWDRDRATLDERNCAIKQDNESLEYSSSSDDSCQ